MASKEADKELRAWPRRLVHLPSMTSLERSTEGFYGTFHEPAFSAVSYTWGQYTISCGPAPEIIGVSKCIPSIKSAYFTVEAFH